MSMNHIAVRQYRRFHNINQKDFWARIGVSQVSGCHYELGKKPIPKRVELIYGIAYGNDPLSRVADLRGVTVEALIAEYHASNGQS